ncbi:hypothetical protein CUJ83_03335 [Methanocella sp. CWC-04]|uniref:Calcineurin-like phosphoesterase domain-containing protein n=1 Tax=Methanooceanicella nereidis TaxID=2052831 RepID=A0AAP2W5C3_9EURY|nr:metallophosphoesterase family protein [Methanocella sp. CWC-04]MCD1294027.1 hypothetical protein [Methanocella sp. CWC-04]
MRLLCFSDVHGNVEAVRAMISDTRKRGIDYDAAIAAGDLTNAVVTKDIEKAQECYDTMLSMLTKEYGRVYHVPGNRDYTGRGKKRRTLNFNKGIFIKPGEILPLSPDLGITASPELADNNTILVQHSCLRYYGRFKRISVISSKAFLHICGHTHTGVYTGNYLNTCFLYRDSSNGARPMLGGYFEVEIDDRDREIDVRFNALGPIKRKDLKMNNFTGSIYTPYGNSFPVSLIVE